jgi:polyhydroxyalkanoate synthesis regulator phasin
MADFSWSSLSPEQIQTAKQIKSEAISQGIDPAYALSIGYMESSFNPKAKASTTTAQGPMQLVKGTAKDLNVDPSDPAQNIKGGVSYLKQHMDKYNDPFVSAIAYKAGPGVADQFMKDKDLTKLDKDTINYLKSLKKNYNPTSQQEQPKVAEATKEAHKEDTKPPSLTDIAKQQLSEQLSPVTDFFTKPTEPQEVSGKRILASTGIGAGTGALLGFGVPGAILGGLEGFTSGVAGEISRKAGAPEAVTLGTELVASGIPGLVKKAATSEAVKYLMSYGKRSIGSKIPEISPEARAFLKAKETQFGKDVVQGMSDVTASEATQEALARQVKEQMGIDVMAGEKVSNVVREKLYEDMGKSGIPAFVKSPAEYKDMANRLDALVQRGRLTKEQAKTVDQIFKNQLSSNPLIAKTAGSDIVNLIQHGGIAKTVYKDGVPTKEISTLIGKEDIAALREPFDNYLEKHIGSKAFSNLKSIEQQEFIASARDSIPTIIKGFSKEGSREYTSALNNIAKSPEGQKDFLNAVNKHLMDVDKAGNMVKEWNKIKVGIKNTNALTPTQIKTIDQKITEIPAIISKEKRNLLIKNAVRRMITSFSGDVMTGMGVGVQ